MNDPNETITKFFRVIGSGQAYINVLYLLLSFPLGIFYFVFLITGIAAGVPLLIVWIGVPILLLVAGGWWLLAAFERQMAIAMLKEEIGPMTHPSDPDADLWIRFKTFFTNPVTWKSLGYLFMKFPLGIAAFVTVVTLGALTFTFLTAPLTYQIANISIDFGPSFYGWHLDSMSDALTATLIGLILWPVSLHIFNGLTWVSARLAQLMLGHREESISDSSSDAPVEV